MCTFTRIVLDPRLLAGSHTLPQDHDISDDDYDIDPVPPDQHDIPDFW
jgi:hypothetical protein